MCLGVIAKVIEVKGSTAIVDFGGGVKKEVLVTSPVEEGDLVMVHAGIIIAKVRPEEARSTLEMYKEVAVSLAEAEGMDRKKAEEMYNKMLDELMREWGLK